MHENFSAIGERAGDEFDGAGEEDEDVVFFDVVDGDDVVGFVGGEERGVEGGAEDAEDVGDGGGGEGVATEGVEAGRVLVRGRRGGGG